MTALSVNHVHLDLDCDAQLFIIDVLDKTMTIVIVVTKSSFLGNCFIQGCRKNELTPRSDWLKCSLTLYPQLHISLPSTIKAPKQPQ
jgi:hypothetical protein